MTSKSSVCVALKLTLIATALVRVSSSATPHVSASVQQQGAVKVFRCQVPVCPGSLPAGSHNSFRVYVPDGTCGGAITDLDVSLYIRHPNRHSVSVDLRGPNRNSPLFSALDGSSDNLGTFSTDLTLDDDARRDVEDGPCESEGDDQCFGRFRTNGRSLLQQQGLGASGWWSLDVTTDRTGGDGTIDHWQLAFTCPDAAASATPTSGVQQPTPTPRPIYLPLVRRDDCPIPYIYADIVLVFDMSTSMRDLTTAGRPKYQAAIDGAQRMVANLRLNPGEDQVAIVTFNTSAELVLPLTSDRATVMRKLSELSTVRSESRIDLGIREATKELLGPRRHGILSNLILLSDGKSNPVPVSEAIRAADDARKQAVLVYVVAMGPSFDDMSLRSMATDFQRYFVAVRAEDVVSVYHGTWAAVLCPREAYWQP